MTSPELLHQATLALRFARDSALSLAPHLRLNLRSRQHLYSFSLYLSMVDYATGVITLRETDGAIAISSITRSVLDLFVDIENIQRDRRYCDYLEYTSNKETARMLRKAKLDNNPYLQSIKSDPQFNDAALSEAENRLTALEPLLVSRKITTEQKYSRVNRTNEYDAIFRELSGDVHSSVGTAISRRFEFDLEEERIVPRATAHIRFELPCLVLIAEALVNASEIVLKMCGHSTAPIYAARELVGALENDAIAAGTA